MELLIINGKKISPRKWLATYFSASRDTEVAELTVEQLGRLLNTEALSSRGPRKSVVQRLHARLTKIRAQDELSLLMRGVPACRKPR